VEVGKSEPDKPWPLLLEAQERIFELSNELVGDLESVSDPPPREEGAKGVRVTGKIKHVRMTGTLHSLDDLTLGVGLLAVGIVLVLMSIA
jgi:hypothetical protein